MDGKSETTSAANDSIDIIGLLGERAEKDGRDACVYGKPLLRPADTFPSYRDSFVEGWDAAFAEGWEIG